MRAPCFVCKRQVTVTLQCANGQTLHVRQTTQPEAELQQLYAALGIDPLPGQTCRGGLCIRRRIH